MATDVTVASRQKSRIGQGISQSKTTENNTMENKLQMLSVRQKYARSIHTHHPRRIRMEKDLIYSSFVQKHSLYEINHTVCHYQK